MSSLQAHLEQHELLAGALAFRRDCPICHAERVQGQLPSATLVPRSACAAVTAAVLATSAFAPGIAAATDRQGVAAPAPESPPPPQVSDVQVGGGAVAPASGGSSAYDEPSADAAQPSDRGARPDQRAREPESGAGAPAHDEPDGPSSTADPDRGGSPASGRESSAEPPTRPTPEPDEAAATQPSVTSDHDTPEVSATPTPADTEPAPTPVSDAREGTVPERSSTGQPTLPSADIRRSVGSNRSAPTSIRRAEEDGRGSARRGTRRVEGTPVRATRATDVVHVAPDEPTSYTVRPGDSLWRIAERHLGPRATTTATAQEVARLWETNQQRIGTGNPDLIFPGQTLRV
jgi:nucleoid-associated protein YgaU